MKLHFHPEWHARKFDERKCYFLKFIKNILLSCSRCPKSLEVSFEKSKRVFTDISFSLLSPLSFPLSLTLKAPRTSPSVLADLFRPGKYGSRRWIRRILLLLRSRNSQRRLLLRYSHRLSETRSEVAPGPVGEESGAGRRGEAAVPANPGGLLSSV